jgi:hypothetical protein
VAKQEGMEMNTREAVKICKVAPRRSKRDEMIADVEAKTNAKGLGLTADVLQYGDMIPMEDPTVRSSSSCGQFLYIYFLFIPSFPRSRSWTCIGEYG